MACGIYLITHKDTAQKYVGQSNDIKRRWQQHSRGYDVEHSWIDNAIRKHGVDKFIFQIITELHDDENVLLNHERYWIKFYNAYEDKSHYNLTPGEILTLCVFQKLLKRCLVRTIVFLVCTILKKLVGKLVKPKKV